MKWRHFRHAQVAEDLQVSTSTLGRWVAAATGTTGCRRGSHNKPADSNSTNPDQLARRVAELEAENTFSTCQHHQSKVSKDASRCVADSDRQKQQCPHCSEHAMMGR